MRNQGRERSWEDDQVSDVLTVLFVRTRKEGKCSRVCSNLTFFTEKGEMRVKTICYWRIYWRIHHASSFTLDLPLTSASCILLYSWSWRIQLHYDSQEVQITTKLTEEVQTKKHYSLDKSLLRRKKRVCVSIVWLKHPSLLLRHIFLSVREAFSCLIFQYHLPSLREQFLFQHYSCSWSGVSLAVVYTDHWQFKQHFIVFNLLSINE